MRVNKWDVLVKGKAFARNHLVISMRKSVGLEVTQYDVYFVYIV